MSTRRLFVIVFGISTKFLNDRSGYSPAAEDYHSNVSFDARALDNFC